MEGLDKNSEIQDSGVILVRDSLVLVLELGKWSRESDGLNGMLSRSRYSLVCSSVILRDVVVKKFEKHCCKLGRVCMCRDIIYNASERGWTNLGRQVVRATKLFAVAPNICGSSVWNFLDVTLQVNTIFMWLVGFWKMYVPLPQQNNSCT